MEARHTAGKWYVDKDKATVAMAGQCVITAPAPDDAPFLVALKVLADWPLQSTCFDGLPAKNAAESLANVRRFARTAIAKAEGVTRC